LRILLYILTLFISTGMTVYGQLYINWLDKSKDNRFNIHKLTSFEEGKEFNEENERESYENNEIQKRWIWFWEQRTYPLNQLPDINHYYNFSHTKKKKKDTPLSPVWSFLGPTQSSGGIHGIGRVNVIKTDPKNENILWAGAASGGLWKSTDGGKTWNTNTDDFASLGISDIVIQPNNSKIMYVATGDADAASTFSIGVLKSTDGGKSWGLD